MKKIIGMATAMDAMFGDLIPKPEPSRVSQQEIIKSLNLNPAREKDESFEDYKKRRRLNQKLIKRYLR